MRGYFQIFTLYSGQFMYRLAAGNHLVVLTGQRHATREAALAAVAAVRVQSTLAQSYERQIARDGSLYFVLLGSSGQELGRSDFYTSTAAMEGGIRSVMRSGGTLLLKEDTGALA